MKSISMKIKVELRLINLNNIKASFKLWSTQQDHLHFQEKNEWVLSQVRHKMLGGDEVSKQNLLQIYFDTSNKILTFCKRTGLVGMTKTLTSFLFSISKSELLFHDESDFSSSWALEFSKALLTNKCVDD